MFNKLLEGRLGQQLAKVQGLLARGTISNRELTEQSASIALVQAGDLRDDV